MLKSEAILALDIGSSGIKLAEFEKGDDGSIELTNFAIGSLGLGPGDDEERGRYLVLTIKEMLKERQIRPGLVVLSVSGQTVFSRFVKLPPVDREKVDQIVAYEAQQNVPFPIEEVVWDYQLIGTGDKELDVMLAAIKGEIIESLTDAVEEAGLAPDLIDVAPMALYNAARYNIEGSAGCQLLIDIGARSTDLIFLESGRVFLRSIPVAGNTITQGIARELDIPFNEAEQLKIDHAVVGVGGAAEIRGDETVQRISKIVRNVMTRMHAEINRSINFYRGQQGGGKPEHVLLSGGTSAIPGADSFFREKLQVNVGFFNPFENVAVTDGVDAEEIAANVNVLGQVVGLALRRVLSCPIEIDLMPPRVLADKEMRRRRPLFVLSGVGLILILLTWCGFYFKMTQLAEAKFEKVDRDVQRLDGFSRQVNQAQTKVGKVTKRIETIQKLFPKREIWNRLVSDIRSRVPDGIYLISFLPKTEMDDFSSLGGGGGMMPPGAGPMLGAGGMEVDPPVRYIEITGVGYEDKVPDWESVRAFRDSLKSSEFFDDEGTEITEQRPPQVGEPTRQFKIKIELAEPLKF